VEEESRQDFQPMGKKQRETMRHEMQRIPQREHGRVHRVYDTEIWVGDNQRTPTRKGEDKAMESGRTPRTHQTI
jgi:hypothetical protein